MNHRGSRRGGKSVLVMVIAVAALVGGVVGGAVVGPRLCGSKAKTAPAGKVAGQARDDKHHHGAKEQDADDAAGHAQIVDLGEFLVNLHTAGGLRYLQAQVAVSLSGLPEPKKSGHGGGESKPCLPEAELAVVKDRVVTVLSAANFDRARSPEGREALKRQIRESLAKALPDYEVQEVLFTSFVMQ